MKTALLILSFAGLGLSSHAQKQERQVLFYNIGFGAVTAGIGAIINKPKGSKWSKHFIKGFWQGSVGGLITYSGKKMLYLNNSNQNKAFFWPAKILHSAGASIIYYASLNKPFLENWYIDYGLLRFDLAIHNKNKFKVRLLPAAVYAIIAAGGYGKFDLASTLVTGQIVFSSKNILPYPGGRVAYGVSFGRGIAFVDNNTVVGNKHKVLAHEVVHQFQYNDYQVFNTWLNPLAQKVRSKTLRAIFTKYVYPDIPFTLISYNLAGGVPKDYRRPFKNFYEFEAERFATNAHVNR